MNPKLIISALGFVVTIIEIIDKYNKTNKNKNKNKKTWR